MLITSPSASPSSRLILHLLGGLRATLDGQPLERFGYDKARALLAYLALEPARAPLRRAHLAELLWPRASEETARKNLRRTLHDLRQTLMFPGPAEEGTECFEWFVTDRQHIGFRFSPACWVDAVAFLQDIDGAGEPESSIRQIERQLSLYRGEFLQGLSLADAPEFEAWLVERRAAMRRRAVHLLRILAGHQIRLGCGQQAIVSFERALVLDPCAEDIHAGLMQALACNGRNAEALQQYEACRSALWHELGSEPSPQTLALVRAIRRGEFAAASAAAATEPLPLPQARRQRVCVLACEIDARPQQGDVEEISGLATHHGSLMDIVNHLDGYGIALHAGRFLAYFGYPRSQEQAARKAVEAALDMLQHASLHAALDIRIGAFCGWLVSDPHFLLPDATGELTRKAIELARQLAWGEVAVCPLLARQIEAFFELGRPEIFPEPQVAGQRVLARRTVFHPLDALAYRMTPFVGRVAELRRLRELWRQACAGEVKTLLISAEAGMGKSRLIRRFQEEVQQAGGVCWTLRCLPEFSSTPFHPCVELLGRLLGGGCDEPGGSVLTQEDGVSTESTEQRLDRWLAVEAPGLRIHRTEFAELLRLPQPDSALLLSGAERRERIDQALFDLFEFIASQARTLFVAEDLHWADATTLEWLNRCLAQATEPSLLLASARPGIAPPEGVPVMRLPPLAAKYARQLVRQVCAASEIGDAQMEQILRRADGVPLYLEEMSRTYGKDEFADFPSSLWNLLAARLEATGAARRLAQQAAIIGRFFDLTLLKALWDGAAQDVEDMLEQLVAAGLVSRQSGRELGFRHALFRDVACETLEAEEKRRLHARLARLYEGTFSYLVQRHPERLAQHLAAAGESLAAARMWLQAGQQAAEVSMYQEAIIHLETGIGLVREMESGRLVEAGLQGALGTIWLALHGYGSEQAKACFSRVMALSQSAEDDPDPTLFSTMWGLWLGGRSCTPQAYPLELVHKMERIARASGLPEHGMQVHYAYGNNLFWMARHDEAVAHLQQAVEIGRTQAPLTLIRTYGEDTRISSGAFLAWAHWMQGRPRTARILMDDIVAEARKTEHANTLGFALTFSVLLHRFALEPESAWAQAEELTALATQHNLALWQAAAAGVEGWAMAALGHPDGLQKTAAAIDMARAAMSATEPTFCALHVGALHALGYFQDCATQADEALRVCAKHLDYYFSPELWRMRGEALHELPDEGPAALHCLNQALELAAAQGAKPLELRAALALLERTQSLAQRADIEGRIQSIRAGFPELAA